METLCKNKSFLVCTLSTDTDIVLCQLLIDHIISSHDSLELNELKLTQKELITKLLSIVMHKGDEMCHTFLKLLQQEDLQEIFP